MAHIVGERQRFGEVFVQAERSGDAAGDLSHFEGMRQPGAEMIALMRDEDLSLLLQSPEGGRVDNPVAIPLERRPGRRWRLREIPAPAIFVPRGIH